MTIKNRLQVLGGLIPAVMLALVLLLSQVLGVLHGTVHRSLPVAQPVAAVVADQGDGGFLTRLFSGHGGEGDCRLYDQSSHGDLMPDMAVLALPMVLPPFVFSILSGLAVARWHALFQARGPPLVR